MAGLSSTACVTVAYRGKAGLFLANRRSANIDPGDSSPHEDVAELGTHLEFRGGQELTCDTPFACPLTRGRGHPRRN